LKITEDPFYLYEILGMVKTYGFQKTIEFITGKNKIEAVFTQEALKKNLQENIYRLKANKEKMEVKSGIYVCGKCKSKRTVSMELQLRRADEPMTTIVTCIDCNFRWTIS
jgi:DNA-directed RNA polymerase subunit M/transcription elongation factor TFIIS